MISGLFKIIAMMSVLSLASCSGDPEPTASDNAVANYQQAQREAMANHSADMAAHPDETPAERKARLRKKAEKDPQGADAEAIDNMGQNEVIATAINSAGYLCARVISAYPVGGNINVECVENRNGKGRVKYRIDPNAGSVEPR